MKIKKLFQHKCFHSPYLEIMIMVAVVILSYFGLAVLSMVPSPSMDSGAMTTASISWITFAFFLLSVSIAMISVIAGIGGGVIFTPIMLAFTSVNSLVVRGTGLIVAMFSGLISTGIFLKKGLGNYKCCMVLTLSQSIGALVGANLAISTAQSAGATGEGLMRTGLGVILAGIAVYFLLGSKNLEWPTIRKVDRFTAWMGLNSSYYEEAENKQLSYQVTRLPLGILLVFIVGLIGGFFGMGGGWAITPSLNLGMGMPLKLAAANSGIILGIGSCVSMWPYIAAGSIIPLFVLPWLAGQVIGGFIGSYALARIKVKVIRFIMIGIMAYTAFGLVTKGLAVLGLMPEVPAIVQVIVFTVIFAGVIIAVILNNRKQQRKEAETKQEAAPTATPQPLPALNLPLSQRVYAELLHWVTILVSLAALLIPLAILADSGNNYLNPNGIFGAIFSGADLDAIWSMSKTGVFEGGHYYLRYLNYADSWAMLAISVGCAVGLAAAPAALIQFFKEKDWVNGVLSTVMAGLIICSMVGII